MKKPLVLIFISWLCLFSIPTIQAEGLFSPDSFTSYSLGDLHGQSNWQLTKYEEASLGDVDIVTSDTDTFAEITNNKSLLISKSDTPRDAGILEFNMRHNRVGLFYVYAQTSDNGGQLLFSIQFTPTGGILLEQSDKQIVLLSDYTADQWYRFTIDFDRSRGQNGTFILAIDDTTYGEYAYVHSESATFDLAQITFGSESTGQTAISGFTNAFSSTAASDTSTVSDALLELSISLSSTSISSNLDNGLIVTASLDGVASIATSSVFNISTTTASTSEPEKDSTVGSFILDIIESVIDVFIPEEEIPAEPLPPQEPQEPAPIEEPPTETLPENAVSSSTPTEEAIIEIIEESGPIIGEQIPSDVIITTEF
jgi:hypothetical protein